MEQELERVREREPEPDNYYDFMLHWKMEKSRQRKEGLVLIKGKELPWVQSRHGLGKFYTGPSNWDQVSAPGWIVTRTGMEKIRRGKHSHTGGGVLFYVLEGHGCTVNNDLRLEWKRGDLELIPITRYENVHQHFNLDEGQPCGKLVVRFWPFMEPLAYETRQVDDSPDWKGPKNKRLYRPEGFVPETARIRGYDISFDGAPATLLDDLFRRRDEWRARMDNARLVIPEKDCPLERNRMGLYRWYIHPTFTDVGCRHILFWTHEIPPGGRSGQQKHQGSRVHYVIEGTGYTLLNGLRYDWEEEDVLIVPIERGGTVIQHFNTDPARPAKLAVAEPNWYEILGMDMACGFEQIENSPDYP